MHDGGEPLSNVEVHVKAYMCKICRAQQDEFVRRSIFNVRVAIHSKKGEPASKFYHAATLTRIGSDAMCDACREVERKAAS